MVHAGDPQADLQIQMKYRADDYTQNRISGLHNLAASMHRCQAIMAALDLHIDLHEIPCIH